MQAVSIPPRFHPLKSSQTQLPSAYHYSCVSPAYKSRAIFGPPIEQALHLLHRRRMDCRKVLAFGKAVSDQPIPVLIHAVFPRVIGSGKEDSGAQGFYSLPRHTVHGRGPGPVRDGREQTPTLDIRQQHHFVVGAHDGVPLPLVEP